MIDKDRVRACLTGPVMSIRTPFLEDGSIDYPGLSRMIDAGIAGGTQTIMLTAGDSHYFCLSDEEIAAVTKAVVDHTAKRAMVIAADRSYHTARAVVFARFAQDAGADMVMCLPPDWGKSCTPDTLAEHYAHVARELPVMIVTNLFIPRGSPFGLQTIHKALDRSDNILAIKDDMGSPFAQQMCIDFHGRCAIVAGGQKRNHLNIHPYGATGYLSTFAMYNPSISNAYWQAIQENDIQQAARIVATKDAPFFDHIIGATGGFDAALHGMLELYGLAGRWRRRPYHTITEAQLEDLATLLKSLDLL